MGLLSPTEGCDFDLYLITGGCSVAVPVCAAAHSWLLYDYNVTMAGRVRAARVRCRWSSLRGVSGSDRRPGPGPAATGPRRARAGFRCSLF